MHTNETLSKYTKLKVNIKHLTLPHMIGVGLGTQTDKLLYCQHTCQGQGQ